LRDDAPERHGVPRSERFHDGQWNVNFAAFYGAFTRSIDHNRFSDSARLSCLHVHVQERSMFESEEERRGAPGRVRADVTIFHARRKW